MSPTTADIEQVTELLGRAPRAEFEIVVRDAAGLPVVIRNAPFLDDGTPMPTRYWLVDRALVQSVAQIESEGGCREVGAAVPARDVAAVHARYAEERDTAIPSDHTGPQPSGGVGGTACGVKCLHAHLAYFLAGGDDPVGEWVTERLAERREHS